MKTMENQKEVEMEKPRNTILLKQLGGAILHWNGRCNRVGNEGA
jgi:hypothetical protein